MGLYEEELSKANPEYIDILKDVIYYIRSFEEPKDTVFYIALSNLYLTKNYGQNDGALLVEDQFLAGVGSDLGILNNLDHADMVVPIPYSAKKANIRHAITRAMGRYFFER